MAKTESAMFQEIFDATSAIDSVAPVIYAKPEPRLPTDDPLWNFEQVTSGRTAGRVADDDFIKTVSGYDPEISQPTVSLAKDEPEFPGADLLELVKCTNLARCDAIEKRAPERRQAIERIFKQTLQPIARRAIENYDGWGRLIATASRFTTEAILEAV